MITVNLDSNHQARYIADTLDVAGEQAVVDGNTIRLPGGALDVLAGLPNDADGHYDGQHVWIGGTEYDPIFTAEANVVSGIVAVQGDCNADGSWRDAVEIQPWGAGEMSMERATEALEELGYTLVDAWRESRTVAHIWTCQARKSEQDVA